MGASITFATSEQYRELRLCSGVVVKPIWLLMIKCTVPPEVYACRSERPSVSNTTPCAANAASPCNCSPMHRVRPASPA
eukprot:1436822-Prymnesium_polylepis.2